MKQTLRRSALMAMAGMIAAAGSGKNFSAEDVKVITDVKKDIDVQMPKIPGWGTPPDVFGRMYAGSSLKRKNDIRRKQLAKMNRKR